MGIACCLATCQASSLHHEFFPQPGDLAWTPADWAWAGGLLNLLLPSLYFGVPVVSGRFEKFDPRGSARAGREDGRAQRLRAADRAAGC